MNMGADLLSVGREALLAIGCIQTQRCHTGRCPTGVTTPHRWLTRGLDPALKSVRCANYIMSLRAELLQLAHACGVPHPALVPPTAPGAAVRGTGETGGSLPALPLPARSRNSERRAGRRSSASCVPVPRRRRKCLLRFRDSCARGSRALAVAGLLLGAGCAAAASPDALDADARARLDVWLTPEIEEEHHAPASENTRDRGVGGGRFGLDDEFDLPGDEDFIVLEGIPEPHEPTPVAIPRDVGRGAQRRGTAYAAVHATRDDSGEDRIAGLFPLDPAPATAPAATTVGPIGLWVTGAPFRNWSDGGSHRGAGVWRTVAPGAVGDDGFSCAGPTADDLLPHTYPECLALHLGDDSARHSPVYGLAADGYPVHGPWADLELPARSSWRLRDYETAGSATGCGEPGRRTCLLADPLDPKSGDGSRSRSRARHRGRSSRGVLRGLLVRHRTRRRIAPRPRRLQRSRPRRHRVPLPHHPDPERRRQLHRRVPVHPRPLVPRRAAAGRRERGWRQALRHDRYRPDRRSGHAPRDP